MAVGIIGLCLGMLFAHIVAGSSSGGFALFALLTIAHLACNYKVTTPAAQFSNRSWHCTFQAVCSVRLTSISDERMGAMVRNSLRTAAFCAFAIE
jgi:hypothetical protein